VLPESRQSRRESWPLVKMFSTDEKSRAEGETVLMFTENKFRWRVVVKIPRGFSSG
jgi:hypothetical protein